MNIITMSALTHAFRTPLAFSIKLIQKKRNNVYDKLLLLERT